MKLSDLPYFWQHRIRRLRENDTKEWRLSATWWNKKPYTGAAIGMRTQCLAAVRFYLDVIQNKDIEEAFGRWVEQPGRHGKYWSEDCMNLYQSLFYQHFTAARREVLHARKNPQETNAQETNAR